MFKPYQKPEFIVNREDCSLIYFSKTRKFLVVQGVLEEFFQDALNLEDQDFDFYIEKLIVSYPEIKSCFIPPQARSGNDHPLIDDALLSSFASTVLKVNKQAVSAKFSLIDLKDIFLAPYKHLVTSDTSISPKQSLNIVDQEEDLCLFSGPEFIDKSLKAEYYELQAQFANKLIEYYHNLNTSEWICSLHACAVKKNNRTYLILGASGAGKSTLTALLSASGYRFVGDDLILMDPKFNIYDNPAGLSVKENSWSVVADYFHELSSINQSDRIKGNTKMKYLPLHVLQHNSPQKHKVSALIWVDYKPNVKTHFKPLSSVDVSSRLIPDTWVNPESDYPELFANWLMDAKGYQLTYSDFNSVNKILNEQI